MDVLNASLPGTKYCGVPSHQALANDPTAGGVVADETDVDVEEAAVAVEADSSTEAEHTEGAVAVATDTEAEGEAPEEARDDT